MNKPLGNMGGGRLRVLMALAEVARLPRHPESKQSITWNVLAKLQVDKVVLMQSSHAFSLPPLSLGTLCSWFLSPQGIASFQDPKSWSWLWASCKMNLTLLSSRCVTWNKLHGLFSFFIWELPHMIILAFSMQGKDIWKVVKKIIMRVLYIRQLAMYHTFIYSETMISHCNSIS